MVHNNHSIIWLYWLCPEPRYCLLTHCVVFAFAPAPAKALDEYDVEVPATLDSFMHLFSVIEWTESAVDTLRHWTQQEDCGTIFFYNTLTHVSTYDNPFQVCWLAAGRADDLAGRTCDLA